MAKASAMTRLAGTPMSRATAKSWAAASIPRPWIERRRKIVSTISDAMQESGRHHLQVREREAADREEAVELVGERHALLPRRDQRQEQVLDDHGEREAREEQRHEARPAQRPERQPLHQHRRDRRRERAPPATCSEEGHVRAR